MTFQRCTLCLAALLLLSAARGQAQAQRNDYATVSIHATAGFFRHDCRWSIAGNAQGANPNVYSELTWKDLRGPSLYTAATWNAAKRWALHSHFSRAFITAGRVTDTDYTGNNRTNPVYTGTYTSSDGAITAWGLQAGYHLLARPWLRLTLYGGYGELRQALYITADLPCTAPLRSTYDAAWRGPRVTVETILYATQHITSRPASPHTKCVTQPKPTGTSPPPCNTR